MYRTDPVLGNDQGLLLRQQAAEGGFEQVQAILHQNKDNSFFDINSRSSNGNTALHWACSRAVGTAQGHSNAKAKAYAKTIRLLIEYGANHLIENNSMDRHRPHDFFQEGLTAEKDSSHFALIDAVLTKKCKNITYDNQEKQESELALAASFYIIMDQLKLIRFFPQAIIEQQDTFTILSLSCGLATEIPALLLYFEYQNKAVNYIGIDCESTVIEKNQSKYTDYSNVNFICADASDLNAIKKIVEPGSIDMEIVRNGAFSARKEDRNAYLNIVNQIVPYSLKDNCPLLMTFDSKAEFKACNKETNLQKYFYKLEEGNSYKGKQFDFTVSYKGIGFLNIPDKDKKDIKFVLTPDKYAFILNLDQGQLSPHLQRLRM